MDRQAIIEKVSREEVLEMTQAMVRAPSPNPPGDDREVAELTARFLEREGIPVEIIPATDRLVNVVATLEGQGPGPTLLFNGHLDVVPAGSGWTHDAWGAELVGGAIYGRGACDMKGGLAAMIGSMLALQRADRPFSGKLLFTAVADEETGSDSGTVFLIEKGVIRANLAIVSEPSANFVSIGNRGVLWVEVTVRGRSSHSARPHLGVNALHNAARAIDALSRLELPERMEIYEVPTGSLSVTMIESGTKLNVIPDRCTFGLDRRMLPVESVEQAVLRIQETVAGAISPEAAFDLRVLKAWPPFLTDANHPLVGTLLNAIQEVKGERPQLRGSAGSSDGAFLTAAGIPTVLYGPGNNALGHQVDEHVPLEDVVEKSRIYTLAALDLLR